MKKIFLLLLLAAIMGMAAAEEDTSIVYFNDGSMVRIPAEIANDPVRLEEYCTKYFPGRGYSFDAATGDYDAVLSEEWTAAQFGEGSRAVGVKLMEMGITETKVKLQGKETVVPTKYLTFGEDVDAGHRIGAVYAPRSGEASIRAEDGSKGAVIEKARTGRLVAILQYDGSTYTKILYDGEVGYIRTECLVFFSGKEIPMGTGVSHINGTKDGEKDVTLRATASASQAAVTMLPTGTVVTVYEQDGEWYAVEAGGWYGYVQGQHIDIQ